MACSTQLLRAPAALRRAAALSALAALLLQGTSGGHMLLVEHTRCAEHGELVHDALGHRHDAGLHVAADAPAFESAGDDAPDSAHEHCAPIADRRDAIVAVVSAEVAPSSPMPPPRVLSTETVAVPGESRFRVAPKNSPPA